MSDTDRDDYWLPESIPEGFEECPHGMLIRYADECWKCNGWSTP